MPKRTDSIVSVLYDFPEEDVVRFKKYLISPLLNSNKKLIPLFNLKSTKNLTPELCYKELYPQKKYNKQVIKNLLSQLKAHYRKYLAINAVLENDLFIKTFSIEELSKKKKMSNTWSSKFKLNDEEDLLTHSLKSFAFLEGDVINDYEAMLESGSFSNDIFNLLQYQNEVVNSSYYIKRCIIYIHYFRFKRKREFEITPPNFFNKLSDFEVFLTQQRNRNVQIYKEAFYLEQNQTTEYFRTLLSTYFQFYNSLELSHHNFIFIVLINHCILKINSGAKEFEEHAFKLYEYFLRKNKTSSLKEVSINNYVKIGVRVQKQKLVQQFLNENKEFFGINAYNYCSALLKYHSEEYSESLGILQEVKFSTSYYKFNSRILIIENLTNLGEYEAGQYAIDSLIIYMKRLKNLKKGEKRYFKYYKYLQRIIKLKAKKQLVGIIDFNNLKDKLVGEIKAEQELVQRNILIKHLE